MSTEQWTIQQYKDHFVNKTQKKESKQAKRKKEYIKPNYLDIDYRYVIGIDVGKHVGLAVWDLKYEKFVHIETTVIHKAFDYILTQSKVYNIFVRVEDARQRKWFGDNAEAKNQGAGSVKRDSGLWDDYLTDNNIPHEMVAPMRGGTKWDAKMFKQVTGWEGRTSSHSRDAGLLAYKYKPLKIVE